MDVQLPLTPEEITPGWINDVMRRNGVDDTVESVELCPVQEGYGIIGNFSQVKLGYKGPGHSGPDSLFAKFSSDNDVSRFLSKREVCFFRDLSPFCSIRIPACYFASATEDDECALLLEFFEEGSSGDSVRGCSRDDAEMLFRKAAELHARWWEHPSLTKFEWVDRASHANAGELQKENRDSMPDFRTNYGHLVPDWAMDLAEEGNKRLPEIFGKLAAGPATLVHGDMQLDNVWFGLHDAPIVLFDWQLSMRAQPGWDIAWFFNHSYLPEQRREHEEYLLSMYITALHDLGVDYSLKALREYMALSALFTLVNTPSNFAVLDIGTERAMENQLLNIRRCLSMLEDYGVKGIL